MALPGLSLPGLGGAGASALPRASLSAVNAPTLPQSTRTQTLDPRTEWRFEASFSSPYTIRLLSGTAELFGAELAPNALHTFQGYKGAVFTWSGCQLEIGGEAESEYVGSETEYAAEWLNLHGMLESAREDAEAELSNDGAGPRVLVVGPDHVGKSSLVRSLVAWGVRMGRTPTVVNLDPREGLLAPAGTLTAAVASIQMEVESGYGTAPISGPTASAIKMPLVYHFPYASPAEKSELFKALTTRIALSVTSKLEQDMEARQSGMIIDTPGALNDPRSNYELIAHLISEFSITTVLTLGSERLHSDLNRRFSRPTADGEVVTVLKVASPGGAVERDAAFMKQARIKQTREYFFGSARDSLNPHSHMIPFTDVNVRQAVSSGASDEGDDKWIHPDALYAKVDPSIAMTGSLVAIKFCGSGEANETVRDSAVMGLLYVADVDETRKRMRFLAPHPQRWGDRALSWGTWPEAVGGLTG